MAPNAADIGDAKATKGRGPLYAGLLGLAAGLGIAALFGFGLRGPGEPPPREAAPPEPEVAPAPVPTDTVALPIDRVDGLAVLGDALACAHGGRALACTADRGDTWLSFGELPDRILAVVRQGGEIRAATADGAVWAVAPGEPPQVRSEPPDDLGVVDAAARGAEVFLLAHRYDRPTDPLRLPRVTATAVLVLGEDGRLETRASLPGWAGERLLVRPGGEVTIWAPFDARAHRSRDGGRTFAPVPTGERLGAEFAGLLATIERRVEPAKQGRPARALSTLLLSRDGGSTWDPALETEGELVVQFAGPDDGVAVAREGWTIYRTTAEGGLAPALEDRRLADAVDAGRFDDRWLVVTSTGVGFRFP
jgi:hypothetical protein